MLLCGAGLPLRLRAYGSIVPAASSAEDRSSFRSLIDVRNMVKSTANIAVRNNLDEAQKPRMARF
jgi:hypothetical protein